MNYLDALLLLSMALLSFVLFVNHTNFIMNYLDVKLLLFFAIVEYTDFYIVSTTWQELTILILRMHVFTFYLYIPLMCIFFSACAHVETF